jgi:signal transduction histidine kinase
MSTGGDTPALAGAVLCLIPALLWTILCERTWWILRTRRPRSRLYALLPIVCASLAVHYLLSALTLVIPPRALVPSASDVASTPFAFVLNQTRDLGLLAAVVVGRHLLRYLPEQEHPPSTAWLTTTYGTAAAVVALAFGFPLLPVLGDLSPYDLYRHVYELYLLVSQLAVVAFAARIVRRGTWGHAGLTAIRHVDVVLFGAGLVGMSLGLAIGLVTGNAEWTRSFWVVVGTALVGTLASVPFVVRMLGEVLRSFIVLVLLLIGAGLLFAGRTALAASVGPEQRLAVDFVVVLATVLLLVPGQRLLREAVERLGFRRSRQREGELQEAMRALSPEAGAVECCRRALAALVRVMELRGAAAVLEGKTTVAQGAIDVDAVLAVWPADATQRLFRSYGGGLGVLELRELPSGLRDPLIEAAIVGVFPIVSPRRRWGYLFMTAGLLGTVITDEDGRVIHSFTGQLALVLDSAELLERAVAVERSLAHAEKLAAIGELAARIAHEIRNPVTGARSLAQLLVREPDSPHNAEHAELILGELARVERLVADLLRFSRREELRRERTDVVELAREAAGAFRSRLDGARVAIEVRAEGAAIADVDRDKLRQVLLNLLENAVDALDGRERGAVEIAVRGCAGRVTIAVQDDGPGVDPELLPRLFEPFFSLKAHGTGLGLAIVKQTVEAHGGAISARPAGAGGGLVLDIELPAAADELLEASA